jgi:uncharacterized protein with FMN-binding domain
MLTALAAAPLGATWIASNGPVTVSAATKKATPTPLEKSRHKKTTHKKKTPAKKATPTPTPKPKKKKAAPKPTPRPTPKPTPTPTETSTPPDVSGTFDGPTINMRWGPVQVSVTIQNRQITAVKATVNPDTSRSQLIDSRAVPVLRQETLQAQSANIDTVSGATFTSDAFVRSLQGALSKAGM